MKQITAPEGYEPTSAPVERDAHIAKRLETCLIGTIITDPRAVVEANQYIRDPSWMYYLRHSWIFEAANNIHKNGGSVNLMTIVDELDREKRLEPAGGMAAIAKAAEYILVNENIEYACRAVVQAYLNRRLENLAANIAERSYDTDDAGEKLQDIGHVLDELMRINTGTQVRRMENPADALRLAESWSTRFHIKPLDKLLRLVSQKIHVVLGDPGSGKTTLAIQSAYENAMHNVPAYVLMAETDVVDAALSVLAQTMKKTPAHVLSRIQYDPTQRKDEIIDKYIDTPWKEHIPEGLPLYLADLQGCGVDHALSVVASIRNAYVVVDHAFAFVHQGVQDDNVKSWDRYLYFYKKLAALAVRNNLVIVVMNQYTKTGMEDWRSPHAGYGGVSSHAIACSQINLHNDPERNFSHYTCVQFVITKVKARLVTEFDDFNREVSVDPVGKEGAYYINTRWREISSTVTP